MPSIVARQYGYGNCYGGRCYNSTWNNWARWLVLALIIVGAFFIFFLFSCITARRRRKNGYAPYRGTGWTLGRTPPGHAPATYNAPGSYGNQQQQQPYYNNSNNPPPAYQPSNAGYYGNNNSNNNDVELQQPKPVYGNEGQGQYAPPQGPPPNRY